MDKLDKAIINRLQDGLPVCERPYLAAADEIGTTEEELIHRLQTLLDQGYLTRFGPMYHVEKMGGGLTLAALQVPGERFDEITEIVNAFPQVAHNYERNHELNMWFVLATETVQEIDDTIANIEHETGLKVYNMPKEEEFYVGLRFHL